MSIPNSYRKITAGFLLTLAWFPLLLLLILQLQQKAVQSDMKERLRDHPLHTVVVAETAVRWIKKDKEIWVGDRMFDIKYFEKKNGNYIFQGLFDSEETNISRLLEQGNGHQQKSARSLLSQTFQLLQSPCMNVHGEVVFLQAAFQYPVPSTESSRERLNADILTPPPQC
ncbi:MAG: hypothetical protein NTW29_16325 [Bacteroidetes bacterium]|nr:hypothetical protein [Bacteroidota bacterium]